MTDQERLYVYLQIPDRQPVDSIEFSVNRKKQQLESLMMNIEFLPKKAEKT